MGNVQIALAVAGTGSGNVESTQIYCFEVITRKLFPYLHVKGYLRREARYARHLSPSPVTDFKFVVKIVPSKSRPNYTSAENCPRPGMAVRFMMHDGFYRMVFSTSDHCCFKARQWFLSDSLQSLHAILSMTESIASSIPEFDVLGGAPDHKFDNRYTVAKAHASLRAMPLVSSQ